MRYILNHQIPITKRDEWIEIDELEEYGVSPGGRNAAGLGRGLGAGRKKRFGVKTEKREEGDNGRTLISVMEEYEKTIEVHRGNKEASQEWALKSRIHRDGA